MKRGGNVVEARGVYIDGVIQGVAVEISKLCGDICIDTPCSHLYGVLCVTEFSRSQASLAARTIR